MAVVLELEELAIPSVVEEVLVAVAALLREVVSSASVAVALPLRSLAVGRLDLHQLPTAF